MVVLNLFFAFFVPVFILCFFMLPTTRQRKLIPELLLEATSEASHRATVRWQRTPFEEAEVRQQTR